eukprot:gene28065-31168_t
MASGNLPRARALLEQAQLKNPQNGELWLAAIRTECMAGNTKASDSMLAKALQDCPTRGLLLSEAIRMELWLAAIRTECKAGNTKASESMLAKALQDCPTSGLLLSEAIRMAPRPAQKAKSTDALKKNASDPRILASIASLFWRNRKVDRTQLLSRHQCPATSVPPPVSRHQCAATSVPPPVSATSVPPPVSRHQCNATVFPPPGPAPVSATSVRHRVRHQCPAPRVPPQCPAT